MTRKTASLGERLSEVYRETFAVLIENPTIAFLFIMIAVLDVLALISLFLAPSWPFSAVLAPIIRTFWDERFLHYPLNLALLPKLFTHAHFVILTLFGIIITGITIKKIEGAVQGEKRSTLAAAGPVFNKYFSLLTAWLVCSGLFVFFAEKALGLLPGILPLQVAAGFAASWVLQSLFAYVLPAMLIANRGFFKDFWEGLTFGVRNFLLTSLVVLFPVFIMVVFSFLKALTPIYNRSYPEAVLWVLSFGILASLIVDLTVTVTTTLIYIKKRSQQW